MKKRKPIYQAQIFHAQLQKLRLYRNYKTQTDLSKVIDSSKQVYHLWEKGDRLPNIPQLVVLANFLEIDLSYFFTPEAEPGDYDLNIESLRAKIQQNFLKRMGNSIRLMPFVETNVSRQLFRILDTCKDQKGIYAVVAYEDSGITRSILQYITVNSEHIRVIEEQDVYDDTLQQIDETIMLLIDNADRLPEKHIRRLIESFAREYIGSVVLLGKNIKEVLKNLQLQDQITRTFTMDTITTEAFNRITAAALPDAGEEIISLLRMETGVRLKNLYEVLKRIENEKILHKKFTLTPPAVLELCNAGF